MPYPILKGGTGTPIVFGPVVLSSDHITGTGDLSATISVTISKNGAAFGAPSGAISFISSGWYAIAGNATDSGTAGPIAVHATVATADPFDQIPAFVIDPTVAMFGANLIQILGTALTETAGQIAAAFKKLFNVATPVLTSESVNQTGDSFARIDVGGAGLTAISDALLDHADGVEPGVTLRQAQRLVLSAAAGKTNGFVPGSDGMGRLRDIGDTKDRIVATYDGNGNRTSITTDVS